MASRTNTERKPTIEDVIAALASSEDVDEAMARAAKAIAGAQEASLVQIWAGATPAELVCRGMWLEGGQCPADPPAERRGRSDLDAVLNGADMVVWGAGQEPDETTAAILGRCAASRLVTVAARVNGHAAGAITLAQNAPSAKPNAAERRRLETLAQLLGAALRTTTERPADAAAARQIAALQAGSRAVASLVESDQAVEAIKAQIAALVGVAGCGVRVLLRADPDAYTEFPPRGADNGRAGLALESPTDLEERALAERRTISAATAGALCLATPLLLRSAPLGFLTLTARRDQPLSPGEVAAVEALAQQVCLALDMARLRRAVQRLTTIDTLTGLKNREFLFERLTAEIARARRYREPLSFVLVDLDDFAAFNARYGNREGNRLLRTAANLVMASVRTDVDVVCRFGGEEFAALLPSTLPTANGAGVVAERIRRTIDATQFRDEHDKRLGHITVSLGVAGFPVHAEDGEDLVALAGEALRAAKAAGKNRVGLYGQRR